MSALITPWILAGLAALLFASTGHAQPNPYPDKPIRIIVPYAPGGVGDLFGRTIGNKLNSAWGQQVLLENRPGAAGNIGTALVAKAPADGYTLLLTADIQMTVNPHLFKQLPYNPDSDFAPVVIVAFVELVLAVHPSVPARDLRQLIAYAKANPGKLNYGSAGIGSPHHLTTELLKHAAGIDLVHVPYKGSGQIIPDLIAGQVQMASMGLPPTLPHLRSGKLRAMALYSASRLSALPEVPTVAESGFPEVVADSMWSFHAPAGTPPEIVGKLNAEINRILRMPEVEALLRAQDIRAGGGSPAQLAERHRADRLKWGRVIAEAGIKPE